MSYSQINIVLVFGIVLEEEKHLTAELIGLFFYMF